MNNDRILLLILCASFVFFPLITNWSTGNLEHWYRPWAVWLVLIAAVFALQFKSKKHGL